VLQAFIMLVNTVLFSVTKVLHLCYKRGGRGDFLENWKNLA